MLWTRETFVKFVPETVGEEQARKNDMPPESAVLTRGGKILAGCKQKARAHCSTAESYFIYLLVSQKKKKLFLLHCKEKTSDLLRKAICLTVRLLVCL